MEPAGCRGATSGTTTPRLRGRACSVSFWRLYRHRSDDDPRRRSRSPAGGSLRELLANPRHFTFASNHGLMQNLGLLLLAIAFPTLCLGDRYQRLAVERLPSSCRFFVDDDGVIRKTSAGYQAFGLEILGINLSVHDLAGHSHPDPVASEVRARAALSRTPSAAGWHAAGCRRYRWIRSRVASPGHGARSARTLAKWNPAGRGRDPTTRSASTPPPDTGSNGMGCRSWADHAALGQTVATWNSPPPLSHKHADDLSVLIWSHGFSWLTSVGYWPYVAAGREQATSWSAANAPHRTNEPPGSEREARLVAYGATPTALSR